MHSLLCHSGLNVKMYGQENSNLVSDFQAGLSQHRDWTNQEHSPPLGNPFWFVLGGKMCVIDPVKKK